MCARYGLHSPLEKLQEVFGFAARLDLAPHWNIPPTSEVLAVRQAGDGSREPVLLRWGLTPKGRHGPIINARSETAGTLPLFKDALRERRCLLPADGFFEWRVENGKRQPYWITSSDGEPLGLGALWQPARGPDEPAACVILTTGANEAVLPIHDRVPVVVPRAMFAAWLASSTPLDALAPALEPVAPDRVRLRRVSSRVNHVDHDDAAVLEPAEQQELF